MSSPRRFGFIGALAKPYTIAELCAAIEQALRDERS